METSLINPLNQLVEGGKILHLEMGTAAGELLRVYYECKINIRENIIVTQPPIDATFQN